MPKTKKLHWTQTPVGRRKMADIARKKKLQKERFPQEVISSVGQNKEYEEETLKSPNFDPFNYPSGKGFNTAAPPVNHVTYGLGVSMSKDDIIKELTQKNQHLRESRIDREHVIRNLESVFGALSGLIRSLA